MKFPILTNNLKLENIETMNFEINKMYMCKLCKHMNNMNKGCHNQVRRDVNELW